jgi:hypothetical protein
MEKSQKKKLMARGSRLAAVVPLLLSASLRLFAGFI